MDSSGDGFDLDRLRDLALERLQAAGLRRNLAQGRLDETLNLISGCSDAVRRDRLIREAERHRAAVAVHGSAIREQRRHLDHLDRL